MATTQTGNILRKLSDLVAQKDLRGLPDQQLLDRFTRQREEAAFEALVRRHGPLVLGVLRRALHNWHDAEDGFQATFLILARKAGAIGRRDSVGSWLYQVAYRIALRIRKQAVTQQLRREQAARRSVEPDPLTELTGRELVGGFDEELQKLSPRQRLPLVLCYLEGKTRDEAARELGCSTSTLKRRLEKAREVLRLRLLRRGIALPAALLATGLSQTSVTAAVPPALVEAIVPAALAMAAGQTTASGTPRVALLVRQTLVAMSAVRLKVAGMVVLAICLLGLSTSILAYRSLAAGSGEASGSLPGSEPVQTQVAPTASQSLTGRVLDADGKPVAEAVVAVVGLPRGPRPYNTEPSWLQTLAETKTDADGRFEILLRRDARKQYYAMQILAKMPGSGPAWRAFGPDSDRAEATLRLESEQPLRGRLLDLQGAPAKGVSLEVLSITRKVGDGLYYQPRRNVTYWPAPVTTDDQGRFVLHGISASQSVELEVRDERFASQQFHLPDKDPSKEATLIVTPPQKIVGRITYEDTGKGVPHARLKGMLPGSNVFATTDADGRYQLSLPKRDNVCLYALPPDGAPYLAITKLEEWPQGKDRHTVNLALPRGQLVTGKVIEEGSDQPIADANIQFFPQENPELPPDIVALYHCSVASGPAGEFQIALPAGPCHLLVNGPTPDYIHQEMLFSELAEGKVNYDRYSPSPSGNIYAGGQRMFAHRFVPLTVKKGERPEPIAVKLRRGVTVQGRLLDVAGQPVQHATMVCRLQVSEHDHVVYGTSQVYDGCFTLRGCDPAATYRVLFLDSAHEQGVVAEISGKQASGDPVTVRLQPCGNATVRLVDDKGKPVRKAAVSMTLILTPGGVPEFRKGVVADEVMLGNLDFDRYGLGPRSDDEGQMTLHALIPGAGYRFFMKEKAYVAGSGKTTDWGDLVNPVVNADPR